MANENTNNLQATLLKFANADMQKARKYGVIGISQTKLGNLEVTYDKASKLYTVTNWNNTAMVLLNPSDAATTRAFIANAYDVVGQ